MTLPLSLSLSLSLPVSVGKNSTYNYNLFLSVEGKQKGSLECLWAVFQTGVFMYDNINICN